MTNSLWRKVLRDVWIMRKRTLLVVLSIVVGVFAVGVVAHMQVIISRDLAVSYAAINPASATIYTTDPISRELIQAIRRLPEVEDAEGQRSIMASFKTGHSPTTHAIELFVLDNYAEIRINKVHPELIFRPDPLSWPQPNIWPPPDRALSVERTSLLVAYLGLSRLDQGDTILLKMPNGKERALPIAGLTYDFSRLPAPSAGRAYGYITFDTLEWLGEAREFNLLHIVVTGDRNDPAHIKQIAEQVREKIEKSGVTVLRTEIPVPGKLPLDSQFQAITAVLGALGILSLLLSAFLVVNTITAIVTQNVRQIGVMKAIGARRRQIMSIYLCTVIIFCLLALVVAVPLATGAARALINFMSYFINFNLSAWSIPLPVIVVEVIAGLGVPLLATLYPIFAGTNITVREAIAFTGIDENSAEASLVNRVLDRLQGFPRPVLLSLRNTFRRKVRLFLTLTTLILACSILIAVFSIRASLLQTIENALELWQFDVQVTFEAPQRMTKLEHEALLVAHNVQVESWRGSTGFRLRPDDSESGTIGITALPATSAMIQPRMLAGSWLLPDDEKAMVVNPVFLEEEKDVRVGDTVKLNIEGHEAEWRIVGVVETVATPQALAFVHYAHFVRVVRDVGKASSIQLVTGPQSAAQQEELAEGLRSHFEALDIGVTATQTAVTLREEALAFCNIIIVFLLAMAILLALVGGLGLMGTMSLNVLERTREIGIMRAIGASDGAIQRIVIIEGLFIGLLSWVIGALVAFPLGKALSYEVGIRFVQQPLAYTFSPAGTLIAVVSMLVLAVLAAWLPARGAARLSVRETLSYE